MLKDVVQALGTAVRPSSTSVHATMMNAALGLGCIEISR
jgi:hypothetical protein